MKLINKSVRCIACEGFTSCEGLISLIGVACEEEYNNWAGPDAEYSYWRGPSVIPCQLFPNCRTGSICRTAPGAATAGAAVQDVLSG